MERKIGPVSALGYVAVLVAGLTLLVVGGEDLLLLVIGNDIPAKVTSAESHRSGRRGRSMSTNIQYTYSVDGAQHKGKGAWHGSIQPAPGDKAAVRYLPFSPAVSAPKDALVGPGLLLVALGVGLIAVDVAFYKKRTRRDDKPEVEAKVAGKKRAKRSAA